MSPCSLLIFYVILLASVTVRSRAATVTERNSLWPDGIVYYEYDESVTQGLRSTIQVAMAAWERNSCLQFTPKPSNTVTDYVVFHSYPNHEHCTNSVGRRRGRQNIFLGYSCQDFGEILHTLGNIIGLYNEQRRPDRDSYVTILTNNIEVGEEFRFAKITDLNVGYQGERYDYASIMHLGATAYAKGNLVTTEIANVQEYKAQGSPKIGQRFNLSDSDIRQVNRLYNCPAVGQCENLQISFQDIQGDALTTGKNYHVRVVAVDSNGTEHTLSIDCVTLVKGEATLALNEVLQFPVTLSKWQFFDVSLLADDSLVSMVQTFPLKVGVHPCVHHSIGDQQALVNFTFECTADENDCAPNPCSLHSTRCDDLLFDYSCICEDGWGGKDCQNDTIDQCLPDPCNNGYCIDGHLNYTCFCDHGWSGKNCQIDTINQCLSNPCVHANTQSCVDGHRSYRCNCRPGYFGSHCESHPYNHGTCQHISWSPYYQCSCPLAWTPSSHCKIWETRCLQVVIKYAKGLRDTDPFFLGKSDPYVEIVFASGYFVVYGGKTPHIQGDHNPTWNYGFQATCDRPWDRFWFQVWDSDVGKDDPLSSGQSVDLSSLNRLPSCGHTVNLIGGSGSITFDIFYYNNGGTGSPGSC